MLSQNDGAWVEKRVVGVAALLVGGYRRLVVKVPWIVPFVDKIDLTLPACNRERKYGLKGTVTRGCPVGWDSRTPAQLTVNERKTTIQKTSRRAGRAAACALLSPPPDRCGRHPPAPLVTRHRGRRDGLAQTARLLRWRRALLGYGTVGLEDTGEDFISRMVVWSFLVATGRALTT